MYMKVYTYEHAHIHIDYDDIIHIEDRDTGENYTISLVDAQKIAPLKDNNSYYYHEHTLLVDFQNLINYFLNG